MDIGSIDWGDDSAEKDATLLQYFVSSSAITRLEEKRKYIVVGRKGAGKSALREKLNDTFDSSEKSFVINLSPNHSTLKSIVNDRDLTDNFGDEIFFQYTWFNQILNEILFTIGDNLGGKATGKHENYARSLALDKGRATKDIVESIIGMINSLKIKAGSLGEMGASIDKELREASDIEALEYNVSNLLTDDKRFVVLIDDLDLGWDNSKIANNLLLGLLSATNYLVSRHSSIHVIVFLREDVYNILMKKTQHSDRYRNIEKLRWNDDKLIEVLNKRINYNRHKQGLNSSDNPFAEVFPKTIGTANTNNWLIDRTLSRPRELLQLVRIYTESMESDTPSDNKLKEAEVLYSTWKVDDLCSEYSNQYPNLYEVISCWKKNFYRSKYHLNRDEIDEVVDKILSSADVHEAWFEEIKGKGDRLKMLEVLYEIGLLGDFIQGGSGGSKCYYAFKESHDPSFEQVQIHPCFRKALGTVERIKKIKSKQYL